MFLLAATFSVLAVGGRLEAIPPLEPTRRFTLNVTAGAGALGCAASWLRRCCGCCQSSRSPLTAS